MKAFYSVFNCAGIGTVWFSNKEEAYAYYEANADHADAVQVHRLKNPKSIERTEVLCDMSKNINN